MAADHGRATRLDHENRVLSATVRKLTDDPNLPSAARERLARASLAQFQETGELWGCFTDINEPETLLQGPTCRMQGEIRMARIVSARSLMYQLDEDARRPICDYTSAELVERLNRPNLQELLLGTIMRGRRPLVWATLANEAAGLSADELIQRLGIAHVPPGELLIAVEYTIPANELHVPTVADAELAPTFVPKPADHEPRAWDFLNQCWGLHEYVHRPWAPDTSGCVRIVGAVTVARPNHLEPVGFEVAPTEGIKTHLMQLLSPLVALDRLVPFIEGRTSLLSMEARNFERFVADLYAAQGFRTELTKVSHDGGFDVIAHAGIGGGEGLLIQAKRWRNTVGVTVVRELIGARVLASRQLANPALERYRMIVVGTSHFSSDARKAQHVMAGELELVDYGSLHAMLARMRNVSVRRVLSEVAAQVVDCDDMNRSAE